MGILCWCECCENFSMIIYRVYMKLRVICFLFLKYLNDKIINDIIYDN